MIAHFFIYNSDQNLSGQAFRTLIRLNKLFSVPRRRTKNFRKKGKLIKKFKKSDKLIRLYYECGDNGHKTK